MVADSLAGQPVSPARAAPVLLMVVPAVTAITAGLMAPHDALGLLGHAFSAFVIGLVCIRHPDMSGFILVGYALRLVTALYHSYVTPLPFKAADAMVFEAVGWSWAQEGIAGIARNFQPGHRMYSWFISVLYVLFGRSAEMVQAANVLFGSLAVAFAGRAAGLIGGGRAVQTTGWLVAFYPSLVLFSALNLREAPIVFFYMWGMVNYLTWRRDHRESHLFAAFALMMTSGLFHAGMMVGLAVAVVVTVLEMIDAAKNGPYERFVRLTFVGAAILAVSIALVVTGWGLDKLNSARSGAVQAIASSQSARDKGRAAYLQGAAVESAGDVVRQFPLRVIYFLFSPFPWHIRTTADALGMFDGLLLFGVIVTLVVRRRRFADHNKSIRITVVMYICLVSIFALPTSNYGTALRHRAKHVPLLLILLPGATGSAVTKKVST